MRTKLAAVCAVCAAARLVAVADGGRPNVLFLTSEDIGQHLGCYGVGYAETPAADKIASKGMRFNRMWSNYPVCAPARTTLIAGCYAASLGAEQMRSHVPLPDSIRMYPWYLREAGYYCSNNNKEDYNVYNKDHKTGWHESSDKAHWKNRKEGQPFFAVFNFMDSHEEPIRWMNRKRDPSTVPLPKYHPDIPAVRGDWVKYHENVTVSDSRCAEKLAELEEAGLVEDTIVIFSSDHGCGMPRNKRTPLNSGLSVPLLIYFPPKYRHLAPEGYAENGCSERLVSHVDMAPTFLSIIGIEPPAHMQGVPFAGKYAKKRDYLFGFRGRMDNRHDLVRSITDGRYVYARNYHPEIIYGARVDYMFGTPTTRIWREMYDAGKLPPDQAFFWELKPTEELYDLTADVDEIVNLADAPGHRETKERLKAALRKNTLEIRDPHFLPENMLRDRFAGSTAWDMARDPQKYPMEKIFAAAEAATGRSTPDAAIKDFLADGEPAVRYWGAIGILMRLTDTAGRDGTKPTDGTEKLFARWEADAQRLLADAEPAVRIVAAEILGRYGGDAHVKSAVETVFAGLESESLFTAWTALEALDRFAPRCGAYKEKIEAIDPNRKYTVSDGRSVSTTIMWTLPSIKRQLPGK